MVRFSTFLLLLLAWVAWTEDKPICSVCRKALTGRYLKGQNGALFCDRNCFEKTLPLCAVCNNRITGGMLTQEGKKFCSRACFEKTLPKCEVCGKPITGTMLTHEGKKYCGRACFNTILPKCELCSVPMQSWTKMVGHRFCKTCAELPRCGECMLPLAKGKKYEDGRFLCEKCEPHVLNSAEDTRNYVLRAREELFKITGLKTDEVPPLKLVGAEEIRKMMSSELNQVPEGVIRGFYLRKETFAEGAPEVPLRFEKSIYMLYGMKANNYVVTGVHELTHDLISEKFRKLKDSPQWVQEGLCQYTASIVCLRNNLDSYYNMIEEHPGSTYGNGFRYLRSLHGRDNWAELLKWIQEVDVKSLPNEAPVIPEKQ